MRRGRRGAYELAGLWLAALGCGCGPESVGAVEPEAPPIIELVVDADRDGVADVDSEADRLDGERWDESRGAVFLANYDDDDGDGVADADDTRVNGPDDEADLARIWVNAWPAARDGAQAVLTLVDPDPDPLHASDNPEGHVRLFRHELDGAWTLVAGELDACAPGAATCAERALVTWTAADLRRGIELGIEARHFAGTVAAQDFSGEVLLELEVTDSGVALASAAHPDGRARARMRVAPWLDFGSLSRHDTVYSGAIDAGFMFAVANAASASGAAYEPIADWNDPWTEDWMQTGYTAMPAPNGGVQGMRVALARPWGRGFAPEALPAHALGAMHLGPERGFFEPCERVADKCPLHTGDMHYGTTYDSWGNHDLVPPFGAYPFGRIVHGSGVLQTTHDFYRAQALQAPFSVDTSWLFVGHVDEVFGYVPAATARGFKVLVAAPALARQMLEAWQGAGYGAAELFASRNDANGASAAQSIDAVLADAALGQAQQEAQVAIDAMVDTFRTELGLADDELVPMPFLFADVDGKKVAYVPGTVNARVVGDSIVIADPSGPEIDGEDGFKRDLLLRLGTPALALGSHGQGLDVHFADDWERYHLRGGEVHCGTNEEGPPAPTPFWEMPAP